MATSRKQAKKKSAQPVSNRLKARVRESVFIASLLLAVYLVACLLSYAPTDPGWSRSGSALQVQNIGGVMGAWIADFSLYQLGYLAYLLPLLLVYAGFLLVRPEDSDRGALEEWIAHTTGFVLILGAGTGLIHLHAETRAGELPLTAGGVFGDLIASPLFAYMGMLGASLLLLALLLAGISLFTGISWFRVMDLVGRYALIAANWLAGATVGLRDWFAGRRAKAARGEVRKTDRKRSQRKSKPRIEPQVATEPAKTSKKSAKERQRPRFKQIPAGGTPPVDLLDEPRKQSVGYSTEELEALSRQVELKLADFGVEVDVVEVHPGPVITRFELMPAAGVKGSQVSNLAKDLARGLSVTSVRVVDVIPGKSVIGLEIPNANRQIVFLSEILESEDFQKSKSALTLALGKSIAGKPVVADIARMPHLLVAGTTGSGKSVAINAMILSLLYKATPDEIRLIMVDPKMLELSVYDGIPHLLTPVVTDMKEAANALRWSVAEMERRYRLMAALGVRNLGGFNRKVKEASDRGQPLDDPLHPEESDEPPEKLTTLPNIVVVIDEFADMMMIVGKKVEELIARLAQKARASGIHLVLATQRPSTDVITGLIKANIPSRIAFQVSSKIDSRVILDQMGAEQLLGHGDMLYLPPGTSIPERVHGAFVDDHEVHAVVDFLKSLGEPDYLEEVLEDTQSLGEGQVVGADGLPESTDAEQDELYDEAVAYVLKSRRASISSVQRQLRVGYNRAARMIEDMEAAGVVSAPENNGSREVLAPAPPED